MRLGKLLAIAIAVGIVVNIYDFLVHGLLLSGFLYSHIPAMRTDMSMPLLVLTDFVAALVFVWVYQRCRPAFRPGAEGGATFGFYAGVLMNFPTWIATYLLIGGFTYGLAWAWTLAGIGWGVVAGAVAGALADRRVPLAATA